MVNIPKGLCGESHQKVVFLHHVSSKVKANPQLLLMSCAGIDNIMLLFLCRRLCFRLRGPREKQRLFEYSMGKGVTESHSSGVMPQCKNLEYCDAELINHLIYDDNRKGRC